MKRSLFGSLIDLFGSSSGLRERDGEALRAAAEARRRLTLLRVGEESVRRGVERVAYASGKYLESAAKGGPRDPRCEGALDTALAAVDDYLRLADAAAADRRFGGGAAGVPGAADAEAAETAVAVLESAAREIEEVLALGLGGLADDGRGTGAAVADRAAARKELTQ